MQKGTQPKGHRMKEEAVGRARAEVKPLAGEGRGRERGRKGGMAGGGG